MHAATRAMLANRAGHSLDRIRLHEVCSQFGRLERLAKHVLQMRAGRVEDQTKAVSLERMASRNSARDLLRVKSEQLLARLVERPDLRYRDFPELAPGENALDFSLQRARGVHSLCVDEFDEERRRIGWIHADVNSGVAQAADGGPNDRRRYRQCRHNIDTNAQEPGDDGSCGNARRFAIVAANDHNVAAFERRTKSFAKTSGKLGLDFDVCDAAYAVVAEERPRPREPMNHRH